MAKLLVLGLRNSQKVRIILDGHGVYTTVSKVFDGLFATEKSFQAARVTLQDLGALQPRGRNHSQKVQGLATSVATKYGMVNVQVDLID